MPLSSSLDVFFFFNDTATTEIYTLSLHDALPICPPGAACAATGLSAPNRSSLSPRPPVPSCLRAGRRCTPADRKSTRLNSSHGYISYAVFCLKKKKALIVKSPTCTDAGADVDAQR